jgi:nicotinate-nucleotide adenylyltransferase
VPLVFREEFLSQIQKKESKTMQNQEYLDGVINGITEQTPVGQIVSAVHQVFEATFGTTTDEERIKDILREALEFTRATTRKNRLEELGDLLASLFAFCVEQGVDPIQYLMNTILKIQRKGEMYRARGDKPIVGICGGSFDPITIGHIAAGRLILNSKLGVQRILYMPANVYFGSKSLAPAEDRANMTRLVQHIDPRMEYFGYEIEKDLFSETIHTLQSLMTSDFAATNRIFFVVSVETAIAMRNWPRHEQLVNTVPFIVVPRPGHEPRLANHWFLREPHVYIEETYGLEEMSSTQVRAMYKNCQFAEAREAVASHEIHDYIMSRGLYQPAATV